MSANPILEELYAVRRQLMREHGNDLSGYLHREFERLKASGHPIARLPQRSLRLPVGSGKDAQPATAASSSPGNQ